MSLLEDDGACADGADATEDEGVVDEASTDEESTVAEGVASLHALLSAKLRAAHEEVLEQMPTRSRVPVAHCPPSTRTAFSDDASTAANGECAHGALGGARQEAGSDAVFPSLPPTRVLSAPQLAAHGCGGVRESVGNLTVAPCSRASLAPVPVPGPVPDRSRSRSVMTDEGQSTRATLTGLSSSSPSTTTAFEPNLKARAVATPSLPASSDEEIALALRAQEADVFRRLSESLGMRMAAPSLQPSPSAAPSDEPVLNAQAPPCAAPPARPRVSASDVLAVSSSLLVLPSPSPVASPTTAAMPRAQPSSSSAALGTTSQKAPPTRSQGTEASATSTSTPVATAAPATDHSVAQAAADERGGTAIESSSVQQRDEARVVEGAAGDERVASAPTDPSLPEDGQDEADDPDDDPSLRMMMMRARNKAAFKRVDDAVGLPTASTQHLMLDFD